MTPKTRREIVADLRAVADRIEALGFRIKLKRIRDDLGFAITRSPKPQQLSYVNGKLPDHWLDLLPLVEVWHNEFNVMADFCGVTNAQAVQLEFFCEDPEETTKVISIIMDWLSGQLTDSDVCEYAGVPHDDD